MTLPNASYPTWFQRDLPMGVNLQSSFSFKGKKVKEEIVKIKLQTKNQQKILILDQTQFLQLWKIFCRNFAESLPSLFLNVYCSFPPCLQKNLFQLTTGCFASPDFHKKRHCIISYQFCYIFSPLGFCCYCGRNKSAEIFGALIFVIIDACSQSN